MGNHDRPRRPAWASLLVMASTASALTLSNFQLITSTGVPIACILVYNTVLPGCSTDDFTQGTACSSACANGIARVQDKIQEVCDGVGAPASSVLGQALMGNVVNLLCPVVGTPSSSSIESSSASSTSRTRSAAPSRSTLTTVTSAASPSRATPDTPAASPSFVQPPPPPGPPQPTGPQPTESQQTDEPAPTIDFTQGGGVTPDFIARSHSTQVTTGLMQTLLAAMVTALLLVR